MKRSNKMKLSDVTQQNYYEKDTQQNFLSATVFKGFLECEAKGVAMMKGTYTPFATDNALLYGQYVHSYYESKEAHDSYIKDNWDRFYTQRGTKRAETKNMDKAIEALNNNGAFNKLYLDPRNEYEKIVTGDIVASDQDDIFLTDYTEPPKIEWIGKLDMVNPASKVIGDIKTSADFYKSYTDINGNKTDFIRAFGYDIQMAVYQYLLSISTGQLYVPIIFVVSKKNFTTQAIEIPQSRLDECLELVREREQRVNDLMKEVVNDSPSTAQPCGVCDYCISQQRKEYRRAGIVSLDEFDNLII